MANPITWIDPLGLNEVCPETEAGKGMSEDNLVLKETQTAKKLGVDLNNIHITNDTAKTEIKITSEINYSDVKLLVEHVKAKRAQK